MVRLKTITRTSVRLYGGKGIEPNFKKILPSAMKKLVKEGLFEPNGDSFKITAKGLAKLK